MSWPIRFLEHPPLRAPTPESRWYDGTLDFDKFEVGDMAFYHYQGKPCLDVVQLAQIHLSAHYFAHNAARPPLVLALPDHAAKPPRRLYFLVDGQCYSRTCMKCGKGMRKCGCGEAYKPKGYYDGWTVSGAPPLITVSPSINYDDAEENVKHYHGFVQNGVIGDG